MQEVIKNAMVTIINTWPGFRPDSLLLIVFFIRDYFSVIERILIN